MNVDGSTKVNGKFKFKNAPDEVCECSLSKNTLHFRIKTYPKKCFQGTKYMTTLNFTYRFINISLNITLILKTR